MSALYTKTSFTATRNACKLCAPLGASLAFQGIEGCISLLHGSQGCATYIRRYMISHFKEPVDIASSSFGESAAIFGGKENLHTALENVIQQYQPEMIGVATTCLSETIGDDLRMYLLEFAQKHAGELLPIIAHASTPSYQGTHAEGFFTALQAIVKAAAIHDTVGNHINLISGILSPADIRYLKDILDDFDLPYVLLPDYSDTLDGPAWNEYQTIPPGGTSVDDLRQMGNAKATIELSEVFNPAKSAGSYLKDEFRIPRYRMGLPIGIRQSDRFYQTLEIISGRSTPDKHKGDRGRLIDSYADAHKYIFEKRAIVYGEEDMVIAIAEFLSEIGIIPVVCASGGKSGRLWDCIAKKIPERIDEITVLDGVDFAEIEEIALQCTPDLLIGNSKGYKIARQLNIPLIRVGFPIHDRIGGARILHVGYRGTQQLFDRITNAVIEKKQDSSEVGYFYM